MKVAEPDHSASLQILRCAALSLEKHHGVCILDEAVEAAVDFSRRYIPARQLPDKGICLLDTACARVALSQQSTPGKIEDVQRRLAANRSEQAYLEREHKVDANHAERLATLSQEGSELKKLLREMETRWRRERDGVEELLSLRAQLTHDRTSSSGSPSFAVRRQLGRLARRLSRSQESFPLVWPHVGRDAVASVVADWTGIPLGRMNEDEIKRVLGLADRLEHRVVGQRHALETIARRIQTSRARLENPDRPIGVFLLVGPSGTGKTETALALAEALYGGEQKLVTINMSEFQEAHTVSTLKGSPPGYVGYGEGGVLTEAVRRQPYSVVLLDEVEKAHRDVHELFFQVFDKGFMEDAEGRRVDFKNTLILLTSNAAQDVIASACAKQGPRPASENLERELRPSLCGIFPDALLNRLCIVPYYPLNGEMLNRIIALNLSRVTTRVRDNHGISLVFDPTVPPFVARRCGELERGARMIESLITQTLLPEIGREILSRISSARPLRSIAVGVEDDQFRFRFA